MDNKYFQEEGMHHLPATIFINIVQLSTQDSYYNPTSMLVWLKPLKGPEAVHLQPSLILTVLDVSSIVLFS